MVERSEQALRLLLPRATQPELRRARHLTTFLRLLSNDAQPAAARSVPVTFERARGEMDRVVAHSARAAVVDLFRHHVAAATPPDSFAWSGATRATPQAAWSALEGLRGELAELPAVPAPGERALAVARRLRAAAEVLGTPRPALELWDAQLVRAARGPAAAEPHLRGLARRRGVSPALVRAAVGGTAECLLDRGAVRAARTWLEEALARDPACTGPRARRLLAWARLLDGVEEGGEPADDLAAARGEPWPHRIPLQLVELRQRVPDWLPWLAGRAPEVDDALAPPHVGEPPGRAAFGAAFLALFARRGDDVEPFELDAAPGLRPRLGAWVRERRGAAGAETELEHLALVRGELQIAHRRAAPLEGCLGSDARAVAVVPLFGGDGAVLGWARLELDHHLVPARVRLAAAARAWSGALAARPPGERLRVEGERAADEPPAGVPDPCAAVFEALVEELAMKTRERHWWGFSAEGAGLRLVIEGGEGLSPLERPPVARALERARVARGPIVHDGADAGDALHGGAASGVVVPLLARGRLAGLLAVESQRRRDFRAADVERLAAVAQRWALALAAARFARWHAGRHGRPPHFEGDVGRAWWAPVLAFATSRRPVLVRGPSGSGKLVLARWLHFAGERADGPCIPWNCGPGGEQLERLVPASAAPLGPWRRARGGTLILQRVERLDACAQLALAERLPRAADDGVRVVATAVRADDPARETLRPELRGALEQLALDVPPLADRRVEIPALVEHFALAACDEEGLARPRWSDAALAALWRQPWTDNVRELETLVHRAVLLAEGAEIDVELLDEAAGSSAPLVPRLPSRHPRLADVEAALETTRTRGGRWNKTRAAALLGWDPDTLAARLRDAGLAE